MLADPMTHESDDWGHFLLTEFLISEMLIKLNNNMGLLEVWRKWRESSKQRTDRTQRQMVEYEITLSLYKDAIWIKVCGEAVVKIEPNETAESIVEKAKNFKKTIMEYKGIWQEQHS